MTELLEVIELHKHFLMNGPNRFKQMLDPEILFSRYQTIPEPTYFRAVDGVSFSLNPGECIGLVGESGSGKSTLVRMIARLIDPTEGQIRFQNKDIGLIAARKFQNWPERKGIQMVFQDPTESLNPTFTARRCIADPLKCLEKMRERSKIQERVEELAELVGLPRELLDRYPHQLSGGQKARVGIARALAVNPALLLLDEPTTALDVSVQAVILQLLDRLRQKLHISYLFITHDLNVVRLLSHRILVMQQGQIVERGSADDIFHCATHPYTKRLLDSIPQVAALAS